MNVQQAYAALLREGLVPSLPAFVKLMNRPTAEVLEELKLFGRSPTEQLQQLHITYLQHQRLKGLFP